MPLTFAHPAAVLPLRAVGVPVTALVIGSMVPDASLFVGRRGYDETHSLIGVMTVDLVIGTLALGLWWWVVRDAMVDLAPTAVRERLAPRRRPGRREHLVALPALVVGALSHVGWDSFTHPGQWGARHVGWLNHDHAGALGTYWAQLASSIAGIVVVALAGLAFLRQQPVVTDRATRVLPPSSVVVLLVVPVVVGLRRAGQANGGGLDLMAFNGAVGAIAAGGAGVVVAAGAWHVRRLVTTSARPSRT